MNVNRGDALREARENVAALRAMLGGRRTYTLASEAIPLAERCRSADELALIGESADEIAAEVHVRPERVRRLLRAVGIEAPPSPRVGTLLLSPNVSERWRPF